MTTLEELRRLKSPEQRRAQIREAALAMFLVKGFQQTTMRDIAEVFGMSVGHLYNYYPNKDSIVDAIVDETFSTFKTKLGELIEAKRNASVEALPEVTRHNIEQLVQLFVNYNSATLTMHIMHEALVKQRLLDKIRDLREQVLTVLAALMYDSDQETPEQHRRAGMYYSLLQGARFSLVFNPNQDIDELRSSTVEAILGLQTANY